MSVPNPVRLFHITAIANLERICQAGALLSKNHGAQNGIQYQNIAHQGAQGARAQRLVPNPPGGGVHDFVPFYFAPRSPMLMAIDKGRVAGCNLTQGDIVHFETTVPRVTSAGEEFVIYDRNATKPYALPYTSMQDLDKVGWDVILAGPQLDGFCKYFHDMPARPEFVDRLERRMAEFLVKSSVPLGNFLKIGVIDDNRASEVRTILQAAGVDLPVEVKRDWYFLGQ